MAQVRTRDPKPAVRPGWGDYWDTVSNEDYLMVKALIESSPAVTNHFAGFVEWRDYPCDEDGWVLRDVDLDWVGAAKAADQWAASTTERCLMDLVLALVQPDEYEREFSGLAARVFDVRALVRFGSWQGRVTRILCDWMDPSV